MVEEPRCVRDLSGRVLHVPDHRAGHRDPDFRPGLPLAGDRPPQGATAREGSPLMTRLLPPLVIATVMILSAVAWSDAGSTKVPESTLAAVAVQYYGALQKERYEEALGLLHERLREALQIRTAKELAARNIVAQRDLAEAFREFDHIDVAKTEVDLTSIKATVSASDSVNVSGQVVYDLVVFPVGPGSPLMYRVVMDVGLSQGQIIRLTQESITRIDPGAIRDVL